MSLISKEHFSMALKGIRRILNQKADKSELDEMQEEILDKVADSAVQPDWNETDETSSAYIQNKPFEASGIEYVFVDVKDAETSGQAATILSSTCEYELIPGNIYKVTINGVEKEIECVELDDRPGYRFLMLDVDSAWGNKLIFQSINNKSYISSFTPWYRGTASVKVIGRTQPVKKLSGQYIPNTIARVSDIENSINTKIGKVFYGSCSTASSTSAKVATVNSINGLSFSLRAGVMVCICFKYTNIGSPMTLNVNSTGAKTIRLLKKSTIDNYFWQPDSYVTFLYDGNYWNILSIDPGKATTTYYGITRLSSSVSSTSRDEAATPYAVYQAYDRATAALPRAGGTMTGALTLKGDPTSNLHAATKQYVDNAIPDAVLTPTSARIGQTIIVKSVDENGKPTEWEAVDIPKKNRELLFDIDSMELSQENTAGHYYWSSDDKNKISVLFDAAAEIEAEVIYSAYGTEYIATLSNASKVVSGLTLNIAAYDANWSAYNSISCDESGFTAKSAYNTLTRVRIYKIS